VEIVLAEEGRRRHALVTSHPLARRVLTTVDLHGRREHTRKLVWRRLTARTDDPGAGVTISGGSRCSPTLFCAASRREMCQSKQHSNASSPIGQRRDNQPPDGATRCKIRPLQVGGCDQAGRNCRHKQCSALFRPVVSAVFQLGYLRSTAPIKEGRPHRHLDAPWRTSRIWTVIGTPEHRASPLWCASIHPTTKRYQLKASRRLMSRLILWPTITSHPNVGMSTVAGARACWTRRCDKAQ
jgi:hypothetical protein